MTNLDIREKNADTGVPKSPMVAAAEDAARLAKLEEENDRLRSEAGYHGAQDVIVQLTTERDALKARLVRLEEALQKTGRCDMQMDPTRVYDGRYVDVHSSTCRKCAVLGTRDG